LVLALPQGKPRAVLISIGKGAPRCLGLGGDKNIDALLVLKEAVPLDLQVEDRPARAPWLAVAGDAGKRGAVYLSCSVTLPLLCFPPILEIVLHLFRMKEYRQSLEYARSQGGGWAWSWYPVMPMARHQPKQEPAKPYRLDSGCHGIDKPPRPK
jgi:hypothetical protein